MNFINRLSVLVLLMLITTWGFAQVNSNRVWVNGYYRSNGTYVEGYYRTAPNNTNRDNYSTRGNVNPYTGKPGYVTPDGVNTSVNANYSNGSFAYGAINKLLTEPNNDLYKSSIRRYLLKCIKMELENLQSSSEEALINKGTYLSTDHYICCFIEKLQSTSGLKEIMFSLTMKAIGELIAARKIYNINSEYYYYQLLKLSGIKGFYVKMESSYYTFPISKIENFKNPF